MTSMGVFLIVLFRYLFHWELSAHIPMHTGTHTPLPPVRQTYDDLDHSLGTRLTFKS